MTTLLTRRLPLTTLRLLNSTSSTTHHLTSVPRSFHSSPLALHPSTPPPPAPLHSFQPHPTDQAAASSIPRPSSASSRPYEDWVTSHPVYTQEELDAVKVVRHERVTMSDKIASGLVKFARYGFDVVTRYKHASPEAAIEALKKAGKTDVSLDVLRKEGYIMTEEQWLQRILFLESIAGVPGFTASILRHLRSLRLMKRDGGWINTLLQEAENERMHLLVFMKIKQPGTFFRLIVLATQGVFFNMFFLAYILSPRAAHRFVGYLEEEACLTYTQIVDEMKRGHIPEWTDGTTKVPQIAKDYWRLPADASMLDLVLAVRADEAGHRMVNHTLANLDPNTDFNPFGLKHASATQQGQMAGFSRAESLEWSNKVVQELTGEMEKDGKKAVEVGLEGKTVEGKKE